MSLLRLSGIVKESVTDGPGIRMAVFTQGCPHCCLGCHNPETNSFDGGYNCEAEEILRMYDENPLSGITLTGGEPLCRAEQLLPLARGVRERGGDIFCYTGYTFEQLIPMMKDDTGLEALLRLVDILVDGPFIQAERDLTLRFRGSRNQRVLDMPRSLKAGAAVWADGYL